MSLLNHYIAFWELLKTDSRLSAFVPQLLKLTESKLADPIQGDYPRWKKSLDKQPEIEEVRVMPTSRAVSVTSENMQELNAALRDSYQGLIPWRKGPFDMFGVYIDSEWQSFMKWNRIQSSLPNLEGKKVLDVGCGNGFYLFKMNQSDPKILMGIDPGLLQTMQFWSVEKYIKSGAAILPLGVQEMPQKMKAFDVVFSMGVLYHRKSPIDHIIQLHELLETKGQLVLETLVVEGDETTCLLPPGRYAQMRNVWFLPSVKMLEVMLSRNGFNNIKCIDVSETTVEEQRTTEWMKFHSLSDFLNDDKTKTIEGHPLPLRATLVATKN